MNIQAQKFIDELRQTGLQEVIVQDKLYVEFEITDNKVIRVYSNEDITLIAYILKSSSNSIIDRFHHTIKFKNDNGKSTVIVGRQDGQSIVYVSTIKNFIKTLERFIEFVDYSGHNLSADLSEYDEHHCKELLKMIGIYCFTLPDIKIGMLI